MGYGGRTRALGLVAAIVLVAGVAVVIVLLAGSGDGPPDKENAGGTVQRFLTAAASGDGDTACGYLSLGEQRRVEQAAGPHVDCDQAFDGARLDLAGTDYLNDMGALDFQASQTGDRAIVDATNGRAGARFSLVPASEAVDQQQRYQPPATNWRIDRGATAVVRGAAPAQPPFAAGR
jgi:hypothetical protein